MVEPPTRVYISLPGDEKALIEFEKILTLTGQLTVKWAEIEEQLVVVLAHLCNAEYEMAHIVYYSPQSLSGRMAIINNLIKHLMPDGPEKRLLWRCMEKIDKLSKKRNDFIHSSLSINIPSTLEPHVTRTLNHPQRTEAVSKYKATANDIRIHIERLEWMSQLLYFFCKPDTVNAASVEYWEQIVFNTSAATSS